MSEERTQLIEDNLRLAEAIRLIHAVDPDSITHVNCVADRRDAQKRLRDIAQGLREVARMARTKYKGLLH